VGGWVRAWVRGCVGVGSGQRLNADITCLVLRRAKLTSRIALDLLHWSPLQKAANRW
jgi:hypothetical protein